MGKTNLIAPVEIPDACSFLAAGQVGAERAFSYVSLFFFSQFAMLLLLLLLLPVQPGTDLVGTLLICFFLLSSPEIESSVSREGAVRRGGLDVRMGVKNQVMLVG